MLAFHNMHCLAFASAQLRGVNDNVALANDGLDGAVRPDQVLVGLFDCCTKSEPSAARATAAIEVQACIVKSQRHQVAWTDKQRLPEAG